MRKRDRRVVLRRWRILRRLGFGHGEALRIARQRSGPAWLHPVGPILLDRLMRAADRAACPLFPCWGTLLGHVRDGGFIAHDDDIDLGILPEDVGRLDALEAELASEGLVMSFYSPWMAKVGFRNLDAVWADIWFFHPLGDDLVVVHDLPRPRGGVGLYRFAAELLRETTEATLVGVAIRVPARSDEVLALSYGSWRVPDPHFSEDDTPCCERLSPPVDMELLLPDRPWPPRWRALIAAPSAASPGAAGHAATADAPPFSAC